MIRILIILVLYIASSFSVAMAQQTIITMPSSDVLPGGEVILKQSNRYSPFGTEYTSLTPSVIVGTGKGTEMSFGVGTNLTQNDKTSVKINLAAKKVVKIKTSGRFTYGGTLTPSLTDGKKPDSMLYAHGSYICRKTRTTISAGGFVGGKEELPSLTGVMIGIDQTIIPKKLRVVADWVSRNESWGVFAAGIKYRPEPSTSITTAVYIPNNHENRVAFSLSISKYVGKVIPEWKKDESQGKETNL